MDTSVGKNRANDQNAWKLTVVFKTRQMRRVVSHVYKGPRNYNKVLSLPSKWGAGVSIYFRWHYRMF